MKSRTFSFWHFWLLLIGFCVILVTPILVQIFIEKSIPSNMRTTTPEINALGDGAHAVSLASVKIHYSGDRVLLDALAVTIHNITVDEFVINAQTIPEPYKRYTITASIYNTTNHSVGTNPNVDAQMQYLPNTRMT